MSTMATETRAPAGRDNIFTRKIGPMPMWAWLAIILTAILGWAYFKNRNQSQASSTANASQVPQFVNQTFTNVGPPVAPKTTTGTDKDTDKDKGGDKGGDDGKKKPPPRPHPTHHPKPRKEGED